MAELMYDRVNDYASVKITLASPNDIRSWSFGEVKKPETINYRTYRPEKDGLFCERIFGPERDYECACGKYKGTKFKGIICDRCGVKVTHSRVRRKRMGHINLAAPIVHIWFFKAIPSHLANLLGMKTSDIEKVVYFQDYAVIDPGDTPLKERQLLTEDEYRTAREQYGHGFVAMMGAEAVKELLLKLDLNDTQAQLREDLGNTRSKQKIKDLSKRLKIVEQIRHSENKPEWMVMDVVPVIPPDLRPLVLLESGNFATSDLNDLYRRIINRNNRLKKLMDLNAPEVIIRNEKRMLQQSVDALYDNGRCRRPVLGSSNRPLKSLTDMIKGKQGRFRENLLGKRVDYSARSVIVVGPELKLNQCGLPKKIALELYQPFIIRKLKEHGLVDTIKSAKKMLERRDPEVWDILEEVIYQHPVLLNRAPTLHRMGIQAFEPVLVEGNAIKIHPLVCTGFNADFDGDQMAVHLPLSVEAQAEAHILVLATHNIFSPANGNPIISPSQDILLGAYYLTMAEADSGDVNALVNRPAKPVTSSQVSDYIRSNLEYKCIPTPEVDEVDLKWLESRLMVDYPDNKKYTRKHIPRWNTQCQSGEMNGIRQYMDYWDKEASPQLKKLYESAKVDLASDAGWESSSDKAPSEPGVYVFRDKKTRKINDGYIGIAGPRRKGGLRDRLSYHIDGKGPSSFRHHIEKHLADQVDVLSFRDPFEAFFAYDVKKIHLHTPIQVRLPKDRYGDIIPDMKSQPEALPKNNRIVTTVGRLLFNEILPAGMHYYNFALGSKACSRVIDDTYARCGRPATIDLLDDLKAIGFKHSTISGLSFGLTDLRIPQKKQELIDATQKKVDRVEKAYHAGAITERERYNQLLDLWTHCREGVTKELLKELKNDRRDEAGNYLPSEGTEGKIYINPVYVMSKEASGARGNVSQVQQLAGMRGLMSKPSGEIIETPIKANAREGLSVLEYFSSTHGARKGLADTALKTADSGYLTRKLADVAQNVFISQHDCGTKQGITKRALYKGEEIDVPLRECIVGRTARETIRNPITDELIVAENELVTDVAAMKIEALGIDAVMVRSGLTCESKQGICASCYGQDLSTGRLVEEGLAVGIIAAQSIGEPGTQLTMRTFHTGGVATTSLIESAFQASQAGTIEVRDCNEVPTKDEQGVETFVALKRNGEVAVLDDKGRELEKFKVQYGSYIRVKPGEQVKRGQVLVQWDLHRTAILAEKPGKVKFEDIVIGETVRPEQEAPGKGKKKTGAPGDAEKAESLVVIEHKGEMHPRIVIESVEGTSASKADVVKFIADNFEFQYLETGGLSKGDQKTLLEKLQGEPGGNGEEPSWLGVAAVKKVWAMLTAFIGKSGSSELDKLLTEGRHLVSGNDWHSESKRSSVPKTAGLCLMKRKSGEIEFFGRANNLYDRIGRHYNGNASSFFDHIAKERSAYESSGKILDFHYLPAKARIDVTEGQIIEAGQMLARQPREATGSSDIVGGLPRVTEIFEARRPKDAAIMAEISGDVELRSDRRRGKMTIIVKSDAGLEAEHHVPQDRHLLVHTGDFVNAGDPLIDGPLVPQDILRVKGEEALYVYLLEEVQNVYRAQGVPINDKHIEIIVAQMLRKVRIDNPGDADLLPNEVVDKFRFRAANEAISQSGKIKEPGESGLPITTLVSKSELKDINARLEAEGKETAKASKCRPATAKTLLLGITKASLQSESFLSGASFQETTKVLTEAALAGKIDPLEGLKENVLLGHLIPVGTGFKKYTGMKVLKLAEPPAQEMPTREQELEDAAAIAVAAGAVSPDEIGTTVGESRLVAQLLGEELPGGNKS